MLKLLVLHGPNINLLGERETGYYGKTTFTELNKQLEQQADKANCKLSIFQSNAEDMLINKIHEASKENVQFIIFNPAAYTHTSIALRDALLAVSISFIEVHLSNIYKRETFRHHSFFSDIAVGVISGFGVKAYEMALTYAINSMKNKNV